MEQHHGNRKHGFSKTPVYKAWKSMRARCSVKTNPAYRHYGGRGIKVCDRWGSFENFYEDMGERPYKMTVERIDVDGDYTPGNCKWASYTDQARNRRTNNIVEFEGRRMTLMEASNLVGKSYFTIATRIRRGWNVEDALNKPIDFSRRNSHAK